MKKKLVSILAVLAAGVLLLGACGADSLTTPDLTPKTNGGYEARQEMAQSPALAENTASKGLSNNSGDAAGSQLEAGRKLIKTLKLTIETLDFDQSVTALEQLVSEAGGYVESSTVNGQSYQSSSLRSASYTIRVPVSELERVEGSLAGIGSITSTTSNVNDISLQYADTASRVEALRTQRDSLLSMLSQATELDDLLTIQDHLTNVQYQLDSYESQLRVMDNQVDYSTISLNLKEVKIYTPEPQNDSFGDKLSRTFRNSLKRIGAFFEDLAIFLLGRLPILLIWAAVIAAAVFLIRHFGRKAKRAGAKAARQNVVVPVSEPPVLKKETEGEKKSE